jgi:phosphatidylserine decarboxylase
MSAARQPLDVAVAKGEEMGWFEHGSTIILFLPPGIKLDAGIEQGMSIRAGETLARLPQPAGE